MNHDRQPSHDAEINGINRVSGQLDGIKKMIVENRICVDILTQLKAARHALKTIEVNILEKHMSYCLCNAAKSGNIQEIGAKIEEIKSLIKKFRE